MKNPNKKQRAQKPPVTVAKSHKKKNEHNEDREYGEEELTDKKLSQNQGLEQRKGELDD